MEAGRQKKTLRFDIYYTIDSIYIHLGEELISTLPMSLDTMVSFTDMFGSVAFKSYIYLLCKTFIRGCCIGIACVEAHVEVYDVGTSTLIDSYAVSSIYPEYHTFIRAYSLSKATVDDIDDYVCKWRRSSSILSITDYLGLTEEEYTLWVTDSALFNKTFSYPRK